MESGEGDACLAGLKMLNTSAMPDGMTMASFQMVIFAFRTTPVKFHLETL
jgi:hypothetical protein